MRKWYLALAALLLVNFLGIWPFQQIDTGELFIVDTLVIAPEGDAVRVMAEEISGQGLTMEAALDDLQEHAPGQLFLRQVRRLILCQDLRLAPQSLPREVPVGAYVYHTTAPADALPLDRLQKVLEAREKRDPNTLTLAKWENAVLLGEPVPWSEISREVASEIG